MQNVPAVASSGSLAIPEAAWGAENTHREDLLIPRIQIMNALSKPVEHGVASPGDMVDSSTLEILAKFGQKLEFVPFYTHKEWIEYEVLGKDQKFIGRHEVTPLNEGWPTEEVRQGMPIRRNKALNFFAVLPGRLVSLPYLMTFQRSGLNAGKLLSTHFQVSAMKKVAPASKVFTLQIVKKSYDRHTWYGPVVEMGRDATQEELATAYNWYQQVSKNKVVADESSDSDAPNF